MNHQGKPPTEAGQAVIDALKNPQCAAMPRLALARSLKARYPDLFSNLRKAYKQVCYYSGACGHKNRQYVKSPYSHVVITPKREQANPWAGLPPSLQEFQWRIIPITSRTTAVLADIHFPFHDPIALLAALQDLETVEPDCILILGDLLDFYELSVFERNPVLSTLRQTLQSGYDFLKMLRRRFPKARIIWRYGNHEVRWEHYFWRKAPEFCRQLPRVTQLDWIIQRPSFFQSGPGDPLTAQEEVELDRTAQRLNIEVVRDPVPFSIGKLCLMHGDEIRKGTATTVNAARTAFLKAQECIMVGDAHQRSEHSETTLRDRVVSSWSVPCLCQLHPRYAPFNPKWSHGYAFVEFAGGDNFHVTLRRIIKGKVY